MALIAGMPDDLAFCFDRMREDAASDVRSRALVPALADVEERLEDLARSRAGAGGQRLPPEPSPKAAPEVPMGMAAASCSPHRMVRQSSIQRMDVEAELASAQVLCAQARLSVGGDDQRRLEANRALRGQLEEALRRCDDVGRSAVQESASKTSDATARYDELLRLNRVTVDMLEVGRQVLYHHLAGTNDARGFRPGTWQVATVTEVRRVAGEEPCVTVQIEGVGVRDTICERLFPIGRTCPADHELQAFRTPRSAFVCDICNGQMPKRTRLFGCRTCDYDICDACSVAPEPSAAEARVDVSHMWEDPETDGSNARCQSPQPTTKLPEGRLDAATDAGRRSLATLHVSAFASRLLALEVEIHELKQAEGRCVASHEQLRHCLSKVAEYLDEQNKELPPIEQLMDPKWDKTYGPGETYWTGAIQDSHDRGGEPYYCPNGWKRYGVRVPEFEKHWKGTNIVYHGTESGLASDILHAGFKGVGGCHCPTGKQVSYFSPSIVYAAHGRYAKVWPRKQGGKTRYYQMVLQCRVKPSAVAVKDKETLGADGQCDPNYDNKQLEWLVNATRTDPSGNRFVDKNEVLLYGIMIRITDVHPKELPEFNWSTWWP